MKTHAATIKQSLIEAGFVLHKCDNTRCINPEHLYLGTHAVHLS